MIRPSMKNKSLHGGVRPLSYLLSDDGENMMRLASAAPLAFVEIILSRFILCLCVDAPRRLRDPPMLAGYVVHGV